MSTYRIAATVPPNGLLELSALPFQPGELVEVTVQSLPLKNGQAQLSSGPKQRSAKRKSALSTIQGGKYAKVLNTDEHLASEEFAKQKQAEQANEERRWRA